MNINEKRNLILFFSHQLRGNESSNANWGGPPPQEPQGKGAPYWKWGWLAHGRQETAMAKEMNQGGELINKDLIEW